MRRHMLVLSAALLAGFMIGGCDSLIENLIDLAIPYDLEISAPDTVRVSSLPYRVNFSVTLQRLCAPVTYSHIRVQNYYFLTDCDGFARCYQNFVSYGPNQIRVEALDSLYTVIAQAEKRIVIAQ